MNVLRIMEDVNKHVLTLKIHLNVLVPLATLLQLTVGPVTVRVINY